MRGRSRSAREREGSDEKSATHTHTQRDRERENRKSPAGRACPILAPEREGGRANPGLRSAPHGATSKHSPIAPPRLPPTVAPVATFLIHRESIALGPLHRFTNDVPFSLLFFCPFPSELQSRTPDLNPPCRKSLTKHCLVLLPRRGSPTIREFYSSAGGSAIPSTPELRGGSDGERDRRSLITGWRERCVRGEGEAARRRPSRAIR